MRKEGAAKDVVSGIRSAQQVEARVLWYELAESLNAVENYLQVAAQLAGPTRPASPRKLTNILGKALEQAARAREIFHRLRRGQRRNREAGRRNLRSRKKEGRK